jgi:hypothetical protein
MADSDSQYVRIQRAIWSKATYKGLTDDAKLLFLYIDTCPHGNLMNYFVLPVGYACEDLKWNHQRFSKGLHELLQDHLIEYDEKSGVILDLNHVLKFPPQNPNQVKACVQKINELPKNKLFQSFINIIQRLNGPRVEPLLKRLKERLGEYVEVKVEVEVEDKSFIENTASPTEFIITKKKRKLNGSKYQAFMRFWDAFAYKDGKAEAADSWLDIVGYSPELVMVIIEAAKQEAIRRPELLSQNKTPKMAQGWITARRWEDENKQGPGPIKQNNTLRFEAQKCHTKCHGTCAASWALHKDKPGGNCHWCSKFDQMRNQA